MPSRGEIEQAARERFGEPNPYLSAKNEWRYGNRGALAVNMENGAYYNHETQEGGYLIANGTAPEPTITPWWITVGKYQYVDLHGEINREVHKQLKGDARRFQQFYWQDQERVYKTKDRPVIPYRLPDWHGSDYVVLVEGEKDADNLSAIGIHATCRPGGSGKFEEELVPFFKGKRVYIVPDNDKAGLDYAEKAYEALKGSCVASIHHLCSGMAAKADVSDWLEDHPEEDVMAAIEAAGPPVEAPEEAGEQGRIDILQWDARTCFQGEPPPIDWAIDGIMPAGVPAMLAGMGGIGKSFLQLQLAFAMADEDNDYHMLGGRVVRKGPVIFVTAEDSAASIHRRIHQIDPDNRRSRFAHPLIILPLPNLGGAMPLIRDGSNGLEKTEHFQWLMDTLDSLEAPPAMLSIDPIQAFALADINADPAAGQFWCSAMAEPAGVFNCLVMANHHMNKAHGMTARTAEGARMGIRGTTTLVDGIRLAYGLWQADEETTSSVCRQTGREHLPDSVIMGAVVKSNEKTDKRVRTFYRETSGLLTDISDQVTDTAEGVELSHEMIAHILDEVDRAWKAGNPWSNAYQTKSSGRYLPRWIHQNIGLPAKYAADLVSDLMMNGILEETLFDARSKRKGLRKLKGLD